MQTNKNKPKIDEELIDHIKSSLKNYEEPYSFGAWEKFNAKNNDKKPVLIWLYRVSAAAAVIALCFSILWFNQNNPEPNTLTKNQTKSPAKSIEKSSPNANNSELEQAVLENNAIPSNNTIQFAKQIHKALTTPTSEQEVITQTVSPVEETSIVAAATNSSDINAQNMGLNTENSTQSVIALNPADEKAISSNTITDAIQQTSVEAKTDKNIIQKKFKRWDLGVMLAPSFGNNRDLNLGYGVSMSYAVTKKLSINSGIAFNKMNASKTLPTNLGSSSILVGNMKSLEAINEEVSGFDIPLELRYNINKNVYANFGVSGFAVIKQQRSNTFVEAVMVNNVVGASNSANLSNGASGPSGPSGSSAQDSSGPKGQFANAYIINRRTTESGKIENVNYLGFYNLSIGFTKQVYKNHAISFEPFVKLPIQEITKDNLKMLGTGVRLKVGF